ncbi:MAG: hypothetical protein IJ064_05475 [Bacteroidaceae bacterium]|nr:hypothetical protein [Bacteroidaceae bacterium]
MNDIEYNLADIIIGRPYGFTVGRKHFYLYPITLAKMFLLKRLVDSLNIDQTILNANPYLEAMRLVNTDKETCCKIIAYHTAPNTYKDLFDHRAYTIRNNYFVKEMDDDALASLLIMVLTADKTDAIIKHLGIDKERERLNKVMEVKRKHDKNTLSFNGKGIFGTFIAQLKEMGYTDNEILYERGYSYLRLMLADKIVTLHLTDEERGELPQEDGGTFFNASDPKNAEKILAAMANRGVKVS